MSIGIWGYYLAAIQRRDEKGEMESVRMRQRMIWEIT
jgi:hypothetical protein